MKTHTTIIYHCLSCGAVIHAEPEAEPPHCCGHEMVKAATSTAHEGDVADDTDRSHCETAPPVVKAHQNPG